MHLLGGILAAAFFCAPLAISLWAFLDIARRPTWAWSLADRNQVLWMVAVGLGALTLLGGLAVSGWYLIVVRPEIADAEEGQVPT